MQFDGLNFKDIKVNPFESSLFNLTTEIGIRGIANAVQIPKDYVLLNRMVTLLLGICNTLDSQMNPLEVVRPYFQEYILGEKGNLVKFITDLLQKTITNAISLPGELNKVLKKAQKGELEMKVAGSSERAKLFYALGQQLIFALFIIAAAVFGYLFYQSGEMNLGNYSFGVGTFFLLLLFRSMRVAGRIRKKLD